MTLFRVGLFALLLGAVAGCGKGSPYTAKLTGKVSYNGTPVKAGTLTFHTDQGNYQTQLSEDGSYEIVDLPTGEAKITVETEFLNPDKKGPDYAAATKGAKPGAGPKMGGAAPPAGAAAGGGKAGKMDSERKAAEKAGGFGPPPAEVLAARYMKIPLKYAKPETSGLTHTLESGRHSRDFALSD